MPSHTPSTYRGEIPFELYLEMQSKMPQDDKESDLAWLSRIKLDPEFTRRMFAMTQPPTELQQAVRRFATRSLMLSAGATPAKGFEPAPRFRDDIRAAISAMGQDQVEYANAAYEQLLRQFEASAPVNGSIFWNGINELALMRKIDDWNSGERVFAQLEATTDARFVNKRFEWQPGGAFANYFTQVSGKLGHAAKGHVTAVCRCGLRFDSVLTTTELPTMFQQMEDELKVKSEPTITDITIVVIDPYRLDHEPHATFTNNEIANVYVIRPKPGQRIEGRSSVDGDPPRLSIPSELVRQYWERKGPVAESAAAQRIKEDVRSLVTWP